MSREEANKLFRPWRGVDNATRYRLNPAKYYLVTGADQFTAMLQRRGYTVRSEQGEHGMLYWVECEGVPCAFNEHFFLYETVASVADALDRWLGGSRRHVQCAQCGTPLLYSAKYVDEQQQCLKWYGCQPIGAAHGYDWLERCPGCGIAFDYPPPVKEIEDV